jgi:ABC-type lipoprotein export system ATPase subunit
METKIITGSNIHKNFSLDRKGGQLLQVLRGIDIAVVKGEMIAIVGASGSGKSTLLHVLGGLDRPSEGKVLWKESDISALTDEEIAKRRRTMIGFVFQFHNLLPEFSAVENVMIPMMIAGEGSGKARARAEVLLNKVGLGDRKDHRPSELSGGELQRVAVVRALANEPEILFADEPTGNLDSENSEHLIELFIDLNRKDGQTIVVVTHSEQFFRRAHRILKMTDGRLSAI